MQIPKRMTSGVVTAAQYNELLDFCKSLLLGVGPGLEMKQAGGRQLLAVDPGLGNGDPSAPREELDFTQGTLDADDWAINDVDTDGRKVGVEFQFFTDHQLDTETGQLKARTRTAKFDPGGRLVGVSGEGGLVVVAEPVDAVTVTEVSYNTTTGVLSKKKRTNKVIGKLGDEAETTIDTAEACP